MSMFKRTPQNWHLFVLALTASVALTACGESFDGSELEGEIPYDPSRPEFQEPDSIQPYQGDNEIVLEAQERFRTGLDLHQKVIYRTCTPFDGVCHNQKEYPDLHTPGAFTATIDAPCNVTPGEWDGVYNRCEQVGDRFKLGGDGAEIEIGWIEFVPADAGEYPDLDDDTVTAESPGLHIHLRKAVDFGDRQSRYETASFVRTFVNDANEVEDLAFANYRTQWFTLGDGTHILGEVRNYQVSNIEQLLEVGIVQGDLNRDGTFGATVAGQVPLIEPGNPEESYLVARLRGTMLDDEVPGSRMPLANKPLSISEMLALFCYIEGLPYQPPNDLSWPIDYKRCSYIGDPENLNLLGEGVTWARRVKRVLEFNCGGCHSEDDPQGNLVLVGDDVYPRLLEPSMQRPDLNLIEPGDPSRSYLFLKLTGDPSIIGQQMPYDPFEGVGELREAELADIQTWIEEGAIENE